MQEAIFSWIRNIAYYMIMVTAILHVLPNAEYQKYIRLFTGMVLVLLLATPVLKMFGVDQQEHFLYYMERYEEKINNLGSGMLNLTEVERFEEEIQESEKKIRIEDIKIGE